MAHLSIILPATVLLATLLIFEKRGNTTGVIPTKFVLSTLFIVAAVTRNEPFGGYDWGVVVGLIFCLGGDVLLAMPQKMAFLYGLISFLLGHVFYLLAFILAADVNRWTAAGFVVTTTVGIIVWRWLRSNLGTMKIPVLVYILVISMMVCGAWSVMGTAGLALKARRLVMAGATCFYLSDICVARQRFVKTGFLNRLVGLPLYYAGQFMIAFSVGTIP